MHLLSRPEKIYGTNIGSSYQHQALHSEQSVPSRIGTLVTESPCAGFRPQTCHFLLSSLQTMTMRVSLPLLGLGNRRLSLPCSTLPEIAFLGRSNVGKSSVIQIPWSEPSWPAPVPLPDAHRAINFLRNPRPGKPQARADLRRPPGYGYAKISREISAEWPKFIDPYIHQRSTLALCIALIDANIPPQQSDRQLLDFLSASGRDFCWSRPRVTGCRTINCTQLSARSPRNSPAARPLPFSDQNRRRTRRTVEADPSGSAANGG